MASNLNRPFHSHAFPCRIHCNYCICTIIHAGTSIMQLFIELSAWIFHGLFNGDICVYFFLLCPSNFQEVFLRLPKLSCGGILWELRVSKVKGNIWSSDVFAISLTAHKHLLLYQPQFTSYKLSAASSYQPPVQFLDGFLSLYPAKTTSFPNKLAAGVSQKYTSLHQRSACLTDIH